MRIGYDRAVLIATCRLHACSFMVVCEAREVLKPELPARHATDCH